MFDDDDGSDGWGLIFFSFTRELGCIRFLCQGSASVVGISSS